MLFTWSKVLTKQYVSSSLILFSKNNYILVIAIKICLQNQNRTKLWLISQYVNPMFMATAKPVMCMLHCVQKKTHLLLYGIPLSYNLTSKLSKFNGDRWSLMIDSSFLTRVSSLRPAPVDIAAVLWCCEGPGRHQIESRDCETSNVRIKLVSTCRTSTRRLWKLTGSGWMSYLAFIHCISTRNAVVLCLILGKWQRRSAL